MSTFKISIWICRGCDEDTNTVDNTYCSKCGGSFDFKRTPTEIANRHQAAEQAVQEQMFADAMSSCGVDDLPIRICQHYPKNIHARRGKIDCMNCGVCDPSKTLKNTLKETIAAMDAGSMCWRCGIYFKNPVQEAAPVSFPESEGIGIEFSDQSRSGLIDEANAEASPPPSPQPRKRVRLGPGAAEDKSAVEQPKARGTRLSDLTNQDRMNVDEKVATPTKDPQIVKAAPLSTNIFRSIKTQRAQMPHLEWISAKPLEPLSQRSTSFVNPSYRHRTERKPLIALLAPTRATKRKFTELPRTGNIGPAKPTIRVIRPMPQTRRVTPGIQLTFRPRPSVNFSSQRSAPPAEPYEPGNTDGATASATSQKDASATSRGVLPPAAPQQSGDAREVPATAISSGFTVHIRKPERARAARPNIARPKMATIEEGDEEEL